MMNKNNILGQKVVELKEIMTKLENLAGQDTPEKKDLVKKYNKLLNQINKEDEKEVVFVLKSDGLCNTDSSNTYLNEDNY